MTSVLDVGLIGYFSHIFLFLLVFVGVYAILIKSKVLGDVKNLNSIIALAIAVFVTFSTDVSTFIVFALPWFFVLGFVLFFFIFIAKMFGKSDKDIAWAFNYKDQATPVIVWIVIFVVLIIVVGFSHIYGQRLLEEGTTTRVDEDPADVDVIEDIDTIKEKRETELATDDFSDNVLATLTHPKVLGMFALILVAFAAILLLTKPI